MTLRDMFWHVLEEPGDNMLVPLPGASECQLSSFTGKRGGGMGRCSKEI